MLRAYAKDVSCIREDTLFVVLAAVRVMSETTITAELPTALYKRFVDAAERSRTDPETTLVELVEDHVDMAESIATFVDRDADADGPVELPGFEALTQTPPPIAQQIGIDLHAVEPGRAVMSFEAGPEHANPMGTLHGGVLCDVGDAAMGTALATTLDEDESFTTLELDAKYRKPIWDADLTVAGEVISRGSRTAILEATVTDEDDSLVAKLSSVCLVLRGSEAAGR